MKVIAFAIAASLAVSFSLAPVATQAGFVICKHNKCMYVRTGGKYRGRYINRVEPQQTRYINRYEPQPTRYINRYEPQQNRYINRYEPQQQQQQRPRRYINIYN